MDLTVDQINALVMDYLSGKPLSLQGKELDDFVASMKRDIEKAKKNGWVIGIPFEIPDPIDTTTKGGKNSGHWGHVGRPGKVGGSQPGSGGIAFARSGISRQNPISSRVKPYTVMPFAYAVSKSPKPLAENKRVLAGYLKTMDLIDSVHGGSPELPEIGTYLNYSNAEEAGLVVQNRVNPEPRLLRVSTKTPDDNLSACIAHEMGHYIYYGLGGTSQAAVAKPHARQIVDILKASPTSQRFMSMAGKNFTVVENGGTFRQHLDWKWVNSYAMSSTEIFARAYAQYIGTRSGDEKIRNFTRERSQVFPDGHVAAKDEGRNVAILLPTQWNDMEFEPVARIFDQMFDELGWR